MKLSLTQENISKALGTVGRIVSSRTSLPVLSNVLLTAENNRLRISATNLEVGINYWIGCKVDQEGSVTVPARLFSELVSNLPSGNIELSASEINATIKTKHYESHVNGIAAEEFPSIPEVKGDPVVTLPAEELKDAIAEVVVAATLDESRPVLAGVHMTINEGMLYLVATDSYRLAERQIELPKEHKGELAVIVPTRTMQELVRILGDSSGDVELRVSDNQAMFRTEDVELVSRLIEGQFPNYKQIIPETSDTVAIIDTAEFTRLTKMASLFARENAGSIRIEVQAEGEIRIMSSASQVGENTSTAECEVSGEDGEISLNSRYLSDALAAVKTKEVSFSISGKLNPGVIMPEGDDADEYLHIIMPLRS